MTISPSIWPGVAVISEKSARMVLPAATVPWKKDSSIESPSPSTVTMQLYMELLPMLYIEKYTGTLSPSMGSPSIVGSSILSLIFCIMVTGIDAEDWPFESVAGLVFVPS